MAKVTHKTMTPAHLKAARALLGLSAEEFAALTTIGVATVRTFESGKDVTDTSRAAIYVALQDHGAQLMNGGRPGVRITEPQKWAVNLKKTDCPSCGEALPALRTPSNLRQLLWGGWTCSKCGAEISKFGQKLGAKSDQSHKG